VAQFYDHVTETDLPKWLIAFDTPVEAEAFKTRKEWRETVLIEKGCKLSTSGHAEKPPNQPNPPNPAEDSKQEEERRRYQRAGGESNKL
jgi:hypothetical protein